MAYLPMVGPGGGDSSKVDLNNFTIVANGSSGNNTNRCSIIMNKSFKKDGIAYIYLRLKILNLNGLSTINAANYPSMNSWDLLRNLPLPDGLSQIVGTGVVATDNKGVSTTYHGYKPIKNVGPLTYQIYPTSGDSYNSAILAVTFRSSIDMNDGYEHYALINCSYPLLST